MSLIVFRELQCDRRGKIEGKVLMKLFDKERNIVGKLEGDDWREGKEVGLLNQGCRETLSRKFF
jgi:hypothetical protein